MNTCQNRKVLDFGVLIDMTERKPGTLSFQNFVYIFYINSAYQPDNKTWGKIRQIKIEPFKRRPNLDYTSSNIFRCIQRKIICTRQDYGIFYVLYIR